MADNPRERRHYFRIDDKVSLRVRQLSEEEFQARLQRGTPADDEVSGVLTQLRTLTNQMGNALLSIRKSSPDVAQYLQVLDKKIEILARHLEGGRGEPIAPDTKVNLGTGGMAFWNDAPLANDTKLEIRLVLFPSHLRIMALGHVVHTEEDPQVPAERRFRTGVEFVRIGEVEQEGLARHLIELQSAQLRRQRGR
jgi:hypothetical protein